MTFASDKLYKEYLRRNMPRIVTKVKVREIIPHLPCLTDHDRENIEAKREMNGNFDSMVLLLDCLKRRENWPEEFISALEECNHPTVAADIRREYDALRGNSNAGSVIRAHVHAEPSASHLPIPERGGSSEAAVTRPAEASAPPEPAAEASPPVQVPPEPQPPETSAAPDAPPPEPEQPAQAVLVPVPRTPPPSPEMQPTRAAGRSPPPPREDISHQEPVENSETEDSAVIPEQLSTLDAPHPSRSVEQSETDTPSQGEDLQTTTPTDEFRSPPSPPATDVNSNTTRETTSSVTTPNKAPVQDTTPPVLEEEKIPLPACTQDADSRLQTDVAAAALLPGAAAMEDCQTESTLCLSRPGELISVGAQPLDGLKLPEPDSSADPYSGDTARLEISSVPEDLAHVPACSAATSTSAVTSSMLPCQENGIPLNQNEPEENHYESSNEVPEMEEIRENTLQICEEPSILNMDGHDSMQQDQIFNGEAAKEMISAAAAAESGSSPPASENYQPSEPAPGERSTPPLEDSKKISSHFLTSNTKYFVTAAGVGACALLLAWKFKN